MRARRLAAVALTFAVAVAVFAATRGDERAAAGPPTTGAAALDARRAASTDEQLRTLQSSVRAGAAREAELAAAYLQKARETGDPSFYARADGVLERALEQGPDDPAELVEASGLAAGRHDFRGALRLARRASALAPDDSGGAAVLVDALVELGRYRAAERVLQRAVDRKPNLAAYTRVAYLRELHGDLAGAAAVLRLAIAAGGSTRENGATVRVLLGDARAGARPARRRGPRVPGGAGRGAAPARRSGRACPPGGARGTPGAGDRRPAADRPAAAAARARDRAGRGRARGRPVHGGAAHARAGRSPAAAARRRRA